MNDNVVRAINSAAEKYAPGDSEFKKVLNAIVLAESGGDPQAVGDGGVSIGLFQNNMAAGRGIGHSKENLMDPFYNADLSAAELVKYYNQARQQGLVGPNLVAYVSRYGQRPAAGNEYQAAAQYGKFVGGQSQAGQVAGAETFKPSQPSLSGAAFRIGANGKAVSTTAPSPATPQPTNVTSALSYTVKPGDTLSGIAQKLLGSSSKYNQLTGYRSGNPNVIYPGEVIHTA